VAGSKNRHYDIYYYKEEEKLSTITAEIAEEAFFQLERDLHFSPMKKSR
jgi:hypothetical protein